MNFRILVCFFVLATSSMFTGLQGGELRRGPFLQIATPNAITIRWRTDAPCESVVRYGEEPGVLTSSVSDPALTTEHEVRLTSLTPATRYFYSIGSLTETLAEGPDYSFVTSPEPGQAQPTRVWVIGDAGQCYDDSQVRVRDAYYRYTGSRRTDVWLALGDNAYSYMNDAEYQTNFFDVYPQMFRQTAIWSTIGNHETWPTAAGIRMPYLDIFSFPTNGEAGGLASGKEEYYSFDYANLHFICLDAMTQSRATNGPMANWLRADLAANTNLWIIVFFHNPPYSKGAHDSDDSEWMDGEMVEMREHIVPILEAGGVDLVLCGHSHVYERSFLLRGHYGYSTSFRPTMLLDPGSGREDETGPYVKPTSGPHANWGTVYVEAGCAGSVTTTPFGHHPVMFHDELQVGSVVLDVNSNRLDATFLRGSGVIGDYFTIIKQAPEPLRVSGPSFQDGGIVLTWKSICGEAYQVEQSDSGLSSDWQPASPPITSVGNVTSWTNAVSPGLMRFYRVLQLP